MYRIESFHLMYRINLLSLFRQLTFDQYVRSFCSDAKMPRKHTHTHIHTLTHEITCNCLMAAMVRVHLFDHYLYTESAMQVLLFWSHFISLDILWYTLVAMAFNYNGISCAVCTLWACACLKKRMRNTVTQSHNNSCIPPTQNTSQWHTALLCILLLLLLLFRIHYDLFVANLLFDGIISRGKKSGFDSLTAFVLLLHALISPFAFYQINIYEMLYLESTQKKKILE